jgi:hypothetical protein
MDNLVIIIIPVYKPTLTAYEKMAISQCLKVLHNYKIVAVKPHNVSLRDYNLEFQEVISFDNEFFVDVAGYNKLMLSSFFYKLFLDYKFMLIYQPDAFVFKDDLTYWCNQGYDYIGAPWLKSGPYPDLAKWAKNTLVKYFHTRFNLKQPNSDLPSEIQFENRVGNGGLSLRNVQKFYDVCIKKQKTIDLYNTRPEHYFGEDVFWSVEANRDRKHVNIPGYKVGIRFSIEQNVDYAMSLNNGELPFACHAWDRDIEVWRPYFKKAGITI